MSPSLAAPPQRPRRAAGARLLRCSIFALLCSMGAAGGAAADPPDAPDGGLDARAAFDAALDLIGRDDAGAAARLEALAADDPQGEYADDALVEAAQLFEDKLGRPDHARDLYARLLAIAPGSRLALRARARFDFLEGALKGPSGAAAVLGEYQKILSGFATRPQAESARMMDALVAAHSDFALADKAMLWLAGLSARDGRLDEAQRRYADVERRFPDGEAWGLARQGRAEAALAAGRLNEAGDLFRSLAEGGGGRAFAGARVAAATAGLHAVKSAARRRLAFGLSLAYLAAWFGLTLVASRPLRRIDKMPIEVLFYLPVAGLFVAAAARESRAVAWATAIIAAGGGLLLLVSVAATARRLERGPLSVAARLGRMATLVLAVLALTYVAVQQTKLLDMVIETLLNGPDR